MIGRIDELSAAVAANQNVATMDVSLEFWERHSRLRSQALRANHEFKLLRLRLEIQYLCPAFLDAVFASDRQE